MAASVVVVVTRRHAIEDALANAAHVVVVARLDAMAHWRTPRMSVFIIARRRGDRIDRSELGGRTLDPHVTVFVVAHRICDRVDRSGLGGRADAGSAFDCLCGCSSHMRSSRQIRTWLRTNRTALRLDCPLVGLLIIKSIPRKQERLELLIRSFLFRLYFHRCF